MILEGLAEITQRGAEKTDKLTETMRQGFKDVKEEFKDEIDKLTEITQEEFKEIDRIDRRFELIREDPESVKSEIKEVKKELDEKFNLVLDG